MVISSNIFLSNTRVDRIITPDDLFNLAENIENVLLANEPSNIPYSNSIHHVKDFNEWYFSSEKIKNQYPTTSMDIKSSLVSIARLQYAYLMFYYSKSVKASR